MTELYHPGQNVILEHARRILSPTLFVLFCQRKPLRHSTITLHNPRVGLLVKTMILRNRSNKFGHTFFSQEISLVFQRHRLTSSIHSSAARNRSLQVKDPELLADRRLPSTRGSALCARLARRKWSFPKYLGYSWIFGQQRRNMVQCQPKVNLSFSRARLNCRWMQHIDQFHWTKRK